MEVKRNPTEVVETEGTDHKHRHHKEDFEVTHLSKNSILQTSEAVSENSANVVNSESSNDNSKVATSDVAHKISTVKENVTSDNIDVKTINRLSELDQTTNTKAKYAVFGNQAATINETKNEPTIKVYDAKDETTFLIESTVDFKFGLLFNELKHNSHAGFYNEYDTNFPSTLFSANLNHHFGVGKSYTINNSTFYDENMFCDDKKFVEVGVYATKVKASPNDDSISSQEEFETSSNEDIDEEDLTPLTFELKKDSEGYLINNKIYLTEFQWNTMVYDSDNDTIYCALCDKLLTLPDMCDGHMSSVGHKLNLIKHKPLNKFPDSFIRLIRKQYHCGFCNKLFDKEDRDDHFSSRVHDITTEFARKKVTDKIQIKKVHKIGKYTFNVEENETAEAESDDSFDVYFDEERERQSNCNGSITTVSDKDSHTTVSDRVNCDASANEDSLNVVKGPETDNTGRDIVISSICCESNGGHNITSSANEIVSNGSDFESNDNNFAHSGDNNVAISDTDVVTNGTSDVPNSFSVSSATNGTSDISNSGSNVASSDNDVTISNNDFASSDNNVARSDNDVADSRNDDVSSNTDVENSDTIVAVNSNYNTKSDSGIPISRNVVVVVDSNKVKKSCKSHDIMKNDKDIADKSSDKDTSNNVQTVGQTVKSEENVSCEIKPNRKFVVTKPKNFVQDFLMIEYKDKKIGLHFLSWHMLIKNSMGSLYCAICELILPPKEVNSHCEESNHLENLMSLTVIEEFSEYFVRRFDSNFYHCSHCNTMIAQNKMGSHLLKEHSKSGSKQTYNDTIKNAGNIDDDEQENTDHQDIRTGGKRKRKKKPFTPFTEHENNNETDNNINCQNHANYNNGGHNQLNYNIGSHNQSNYNMNGHNQSNYNMTEHNQLNYNMNGHNQANYNMNGHNQANYNMNGHNQANYNMKGHNQANYNMNDPYQASHHQAWSPGLLYEQMIGDIMVYKFGFLFKLKYLAYNVICRSQNMYFCGLCNQMITDEVAVFHHVLSPYHQYCVEKTPYVVEFGLHLVRHIRGVFHCTLCNDPVNAYAVYNHTMSELHVAHLAAALGIPAERTRPPATLFSPFILQTGVPSRPLLPIPPVSFIHLNGVIDPTRVQNPYTASYATSAGVTSNFGSYFADQTSYVPPNFEGNFNAFSPGQSFNVEPTIASVQNNLPPNASMPQNKAHNVGDTTITEDHLAKILLDAQRNCDLPRDETRSQQSLTTNYPLAQFIRKDGPENPFQTSVSHESQNVNTMKCENLAQDIFKYTQNSAVERNTALAKNDLIVNETTPHINTEVGAHNTIGSEEIEIQNINDTIGYEKLGLDLLDHIKNFDIAQDSKSVESNLTSDETVPKKNIETDDQEMSGSKSYKPSNINDTIGYKIFAVNLLDQVKESNVTQFYDVATSAQSNSTLLEKMSPKNIEVGVQNTLDSDRYELHGILNDCENLAGNLSDQLKICNIRQNSTSIQDDELTLHGMKSKKNIKHGAQNTLDSIHYELDKINDTSTSDNATPNDLDNIKNIDMSRDTSPIQKDLTFNEITPEMSVKLGVPNKTFFHNFKLHDINGADDSEKLGLELLYHIRKYNIANQDSKSNLTSNETISENNIKVGDQETTNSDSCKLNKNYKIAHENLMLSYSGETKNCNVARDATSPKKEIQFGAQTTFIPKLNESQNAMQKAKLSMESVSRRLLNVINNDLEIHRLHLKARSLINPIVDVQDTLNFEDYIRQNKNGIIAMGLTLLGKNLTLDETKPPRVTSGVNYQRGRDVQMRMNDSGFSRSEVPYERLCCDDSDEQREKEDLNNGNGEDQFLLSDYDSITSTSSEEKLYKLVDDAVTCDVSEIETEQRNQPLIEDGITPTLNITLISRTSHGEKPECKDSDESVTEPAENAAGEDEIETVSNKTEVDLADCETKNEVTN